MAHDHSTGEGSCLHRLPHGPDKGVGRDDGLIGVVGSSQCLERLGGLKSLRSWKGFGMWDNPWMELSVMVFYGHIML